MDSFVNTKDVITEDDFIQYPDIPTFKAKLDELRKIDFTGMDRNKISDVVFSYLTVIPSLSARHTKEQFNTFKFYRVRLNIDDKTEDTRLIRTFSYPPPSVCSSNGRANLKNTSAFYASNSALTSIIESKPKPGDIGYLSFWDGCTVREMKSGILLPRDLTQENEWYVLAKDIYAYAEMKRTKVGVRQNDFFHEALDFVSNLFQIEMPPYSITSWIATELLYGMAWKDFIIYPSVANKAHTVNMVFHPNVVDQCMKFVKVIRFKVNNFNGHNINLSVGKVAEMQHNNIIWRDALKEEMDFANLPGFSTLVTKINK